MRNLIKKTKFWPLGLIPILFLFIGLGILIFPNKVVPQASQPIDEYYFIGQYPKNTCPNSVASTMVRSFEHLGGNQIATCFTDKDGVPENNEKVVAVGTPGGGDPVCPVGFEEFSRSEHIGSNYVLTCVKSMQYVPALVVGEVPTNVNIGSSCPTGNLSPAIAQTKAASYTLINKSEHIGGNYIGTCAAGAPAAMSATLTADPTTGLPPFDSTVTAVVSNAISGANITYVFNCDNGQTFTKTGVAGQAGWTTQSAICHYTEIKDYTISVTVTQGTGVVNATTNVGLKAEIQKIKIREVAP